MAFCGQCKSLVYPVGGKLQCKKCGWTSEGPAKRHVIQSHTPEDKERVVLEEAHDVRPEQEITCPKCGHHRAKFHLMQTRRSDEPPTQINECVSCGHGWREY